MTKEERQYWTARDPVATFEDLLLKEGIFNKDSLEAVKNTVDSEIEEAIIFSQNSPDPKPEDTYEDLYVSMEVPR